MKRRYQTFLLCGLALFVANTAIPANAETEAGISIVQRPETVRISPQGKIYLGDRETPLRELAKRLRRQGVSQNDTVYVSIPDETPRHVLVAVGRELASKGYRRVIFTKPPKAIAEAKPEQSR